MQSVSSSTFTYTLAASGRIKETTSQQNTAKNHSTQFPPTTVEATKLLTTFCEKKTGKNNWPWRREKDPEFT